MAESAFVYPIEHLADQFRRLPGVGRKSAYRLAFAVSEMTNEQANEFADAILNAKKTLRRCRICQNLADAEVCPVCGDPKRDKYTVCVVEDPRDVAAFLRIGDYRGVFHVLGGLISPLDGRTPDQLKIKELVARVSDFLKETTADKVEIILATDPTVEGDTTAMYISRLLKPFGVRVTRLAYGVPVGGDLEYADDVTLSRALTGRNEL